MSAPTPPQRVLYLAPSLLERRVGVPLRGVQIFDFALIRDLASMGYAVTVAAESSWRGRLHQQLPIAEHAEPRVRVLWTPPLRKPIWAGLAAAASLLARRERFKHAIIGNASRGLAPALDLLRRARLVEHTVAIVHRGALGPRRNPLRRARCDVLAVSAGIAREFTDWPGRVVARTGVPDADTFVAPPDRAERLARTITPDDPLRLVMLGKLDEPWKAAEAAVEAVRTLPEGAQERVTLDLYAYDEPPTFDHPLIRAHSWLNPADVPKMLATMDVMLQLSNSAKETFCQTMVQGMLTGLPVISSDLPVLAEKLDAGGGMVTSTPRELVRAIASLTDDAPARVRMGEAARATALERYVWDPRWFARTFLAPVPAARSAGTACDHERSVTQTTPATTEACTNAQAYHARR